MSSSAFPRKLILGHEAWSTWKTGAHASLPGAHHHATPSAHSSNVYVREGLSFARATAPKNYLPTGTKETPSENIVYTQCHGEYTRPLTPPHIINDARTSDSPSSVTTPATHTWPTGGRCTPPPDGSNIKHVFEDDVRVNDAGCLEYLCSSESESSRPSEGFSTARRRGRSVRSVQVDGHDLYVEGGRDGAGSKVSAVIDPCTGAVISLRRDGVLDHLIDPMNGVVKTHYAPGYSCAHVHDGDFWSRCHTIPEHIFKEGLRFFLDASFDDKFAPNAERRRDRYEFDYHHQAYDFPFRFVIDYERRKPLRSTQGKALCTFTLISIHERRHESLDW